MGKCGVRVGGGEAIYSERYDREREGLRPVDVYIDGNGGPAH